MKLVIEIPEEDYIRLRDEGMFGNVTTFKRAVREGIPLEEPCTDVISRQQAIDACLNGWNKGYEEIVEEIRALPPVTPQYTEAEIQKMQELEQAEIQKAYELGKAEMQPCEDCISRDKAIVQLNHLLSDWDDNQNVAIRKCIETIKIVPPAAPQPKMKEV